MSPDEMLLVLALFLMVAGAAPLLVFLVMSRMMDRMMREITQDREAGAPEGGTPRTPATVTEVTPEAMTTAARVKARLAAIRGMTRL